MNKILGYPLAFIRFIFVFLIMLIFVSAYSFSRLFKAHSDRRAFNLRRNYLNLILPILNVKYEVVGEAKTTPALYVSNHRTFFDPAIACKHLDAFVIAKAEIASYPIINKGAELTGVIWVKRDSLTSRKNTRQAMIDGLKEGRNILVYPEGTTHNEDQVLPFKKGTFHELAKLGLPVVPLVVEYRDRKDFWKGGSLVNQYFKQFSTWSTHVKMEIGEPILSEDHNLLREGAEQWTNDTLKKMHQRWSTAFPS